MFLLSELQKITSHLFLLIDLCLISIVIENFHYNHVLRTLPIQNQLIMMEKNIAIKEVQENHESKEGRQTENVNNVDDFPPQHDELGRIKIHVCGQCFIGKQLSRSV